MNTLIVKDGAKLNTLLNQIKVQGVKYRAMLHSGALSVIYHGLHFGDCRPMDRFFSGLTENDGNSFRVYLNHLSFEITRNPTDKLFSFSAKEKSFRVLTNDANPNASKFKANAVLFVEDRLASGKPGNWSKDANGDERKIVPFFERAAFKSELTDYTDASALAGIKTMLRIIAEDKAPGGGKVTVNKDILAAIERAKDVAERVVNNDAETEKRRETSKEKRAANKPKATKPASRRVNGGIKPDKTPANPPA